MAWTTPRTWSPGETVTASLMNAHVRDNMNILKTPITDSGLIQAINSTYFSSLAGGLITGLTRSLKQDGAAHVGSTTVETDASTYTLPGATLSADGMLLRVRVWGKTAAGASTRTIKVYWNAASVHTFTTVVASGLWQIEQLIMRTGAATQTVQTFHRVVAGGLNTATPIAAPTLGVTVWDGTTPTNATLSGNVAMKTTVQDSAAGANVTQLAYSVDLAVITA